MTKSQSGFNDGWYQCNTSTNLFAFFLVFLRKRMASGMPDDGLHDLFLDLDVIRRYFP